MAIIQATDTDFKEVLQNNDRVVVKYFADWCGNCRLFSPKFKRMAANEEFAGVTFLDVNAETSPEARKLAGVTNLPFFAVFKNGELVEGAATSKEDFVLDMVRKIA
jgi:thioredoxin 1